MTRWFPRLLAALGLSLGGLFAVSNIDTFGHLAQGRQIAELGGVPRLDSFSFWKAEPQPWANYEWLSDWLLWSLYNGGGPDLLIVCKLLLSAKPHLVLFGEKDFQQLALLRRMVRDLGFDVEVIGCPTVREPDGLALSSRNQHLGPKARAQASVLVRALDEAQAAVAAGERSTRVLLERARARIAAAPLARIDYAELCCPDSLEPAPEPLVGPALLALAVHFSPDPDGRGAHVRLIDSRLLLAEGLGS